MDRFVSVGMREVAPKMVVKLESGNAHSPTTMERISYIKQMLGELTHVARAEKADLLVYLLEMAFTEASELINRRGGSFPAKVNGDEAARMAMKPSGKI
jgi:hypothetical protein